MSVILVVDDESDVEMLFRQQFRRELRAGLFRMDFALSAVSALQRKSDVAAALRNRIDSRLPNAA